MNKFSVVLLVGALVVVGAAASSMNNPQEERNVQPGIGGGPGVEENQNTQNTSDVTLQQRANMHKLLQEHAITASAHLQALYDGESTTETRRNLNENTNEFVSLISELSNDGATQELERIWTQHIQDYEAYTMAVKAANAEEAAKVRNRLLDHSEEFGSVVNTLLPNVPSDRAADAMTEHVTLTLAIVDAHAQDDTTEKLAKSAEASTQAVEFAEILVPDQE